MSGPIVVKDSSPAAAIAMPVVSTGSAPKRSTSRAVMPRERTRDGQRPRQERGAGLQRAEAADLLEVERDQEERRSTSR